MSKQIELITRKFPIYRPSMYAVVDDVDYDSLIVHRWWFASGYAKGHFVVDGRKLTIGMHRFIVNPPSGMEVDHINGDSLDNRRCNLRICTHAQNMWNKKRKSTRALPFKGVKAVGRRWCAQIMVNGIERYLGRFDSAEAAAQAYDAEARRLHGEYARLNFPD